MVASPFIFKFYPVWNSDFKCGSKFIPKKGDTTILQYNNV
jgi:hypothetical protein